MAVIDRPERTPPTAGAVRPAARFADYVAVARIDHWVKHVFILPGLLLAGMIGSAERPAIDLLAILLGLVAAALASSANYVINEVLDAPFDAHHPTKRLRTSVSRRMAPGWVALEVALLAGTALAIGFAISQPLGWTILAFLVSGVVYNIPPLRTKDLAFWDVATEALNNPIRLLVGWVLVDPTTLPPSSLLFGYWAGGAFLMSTKRLTEYRTIVADQALEALQRYRRVFRRYTDTRLLLQSFAYAQLASFFLAIFLVKYRIEYILTFPFFAALFVVYLRIGLRAGSSAAAPEKLYRERLLMAMVLTLSAVFALTTFVDVPILEALTEPYLIPVAP